MLFIRWLNAFDAFRAESLLRTSFEKNCIDLTGCSHGTSQSISYPSDIEQSIVICNFGSFFSRERQKLKRIYAITVIV